MSKSQTERGKKHLLNIYIADFSPRWKNLIFTEYE